MKTHNDAAEPLTFEEALHTYFAVADIHQVSISGLEGTTYIDKTDGFKRKQLASEPMRIRKETDEVHLNTKAACVLRDPAWNRRIIIEKGGSDSTVAWNPWIDKTKDMSDMGPDDWNGMVCVETANAADDAIRLSPRRVPQADGVDSSRVAARAKPQVEAPSKYDSRSGRVYEWALPTLAYRSLFGFDPLTA